MIFANQQAPVPGKVPAHVLPQDPPAASIDAGLVPAIKRAIQYNELGAVSPYSLSYARLGASGGSFGIFQGDAASNTTARQVLRDVLLASGAAATVCDRIIGLVARPCPAGNPLSAQDTILANDALASAAGMAAIDAMDDALLQLVLAELASCIAAAHGRHLSIEPLAQIYIAVWVNMTGEPARLNTWLAGQPGSGLQPPAGPAVTRCDIEAYLQASSFFRLHPRNFVHMRESVDAAAKAVSSRLNGST